MVAPSSANENNHPPVNVRLSSPRVIQLPDATHAPFAQMPPTLQKKSLGSACPVSVHIGPPMPQLSAPVRHGFVGVQAEPAAHGTQAPIPLQTLGGVVPQGVPATTDRTGVQTDVPVPHAVTPSTQAPAGGVHGSSAAHATHAPARHTLSTPQEEPSGRLVAPAVQVG
jgi:hypothetical protein